MPPHRNTLYKKFSEKMCGQLVRRLDGNYEKIERVTGIAGSNPTHLYVHTVEGNGFWCYKDGDKHYREL